MREDGAADLVGIAAVLQNLASPIRVITEARVALVIEVVEKSDHSPTLLIGGKLPRVGTHACLDGQGVLPQTLGLGELNQ
jgi:hypothetical protein